MEGRETGIQESADRENAKETKISGTGDPRVVSLILFQKLQQELNELDDELTEKRAIQILREALDLIPDLILAPGERPDELLVSNSQNPDAKKVLNLRDAADSLLTVWRDYENAMDRP